MVVLAADDKTIMLPIARGAPTVASMEELVKTNTEFSRDGGKTWEKVTLE